MATHQRPRRSYRTAARWLLTVLLILTFVPLGVNILDASRTKPSQADPAVTMLDVTWTATAYYTPPAAVIQSMVMDNYPTAPYDPRSTLEASVEPVPVSLSHTVHCGIAGVSPDGLAITGESCADTQAADRGLLADYTGQVSAMTGYYGPDLPGMVELHDKSAKVTIIRKHLGGYEYLASAEIVADGDGYAIVRTSTDVLDNLPWLGIAQTAPREGDKLTTVGIDGAVTSLLAPSYPGQYSGIIIDHLELLDRQGGVQTSYVSSTVTGTRTLPGAKTIKTDGSYANMLDGAFMLDQHNRIVGITGWSYDATTVAQYTVGTEQLLRDLELMGYGDWAGVLNYSYWQQANTPYAMAVFGSFMDRINPFTDLVAFLVAIGVTGVILIRHYVAASRH